MPRRVAYLDKVPPTREEFMAALEAFYAAHGAPFEAQVVFNRAMGEKQLDLFAIFRAVAAEGGYDCVCLRQCVPESWTSPVSASFSLFFGTPRDMCSTFTGLWYCKSCGLSKQYLFTSCTLCSPVLDL